MRLGSRSSPACSGALVGVGLVLFVVAVEAWARQPASPDPPGETATSAVSTADAGRHSVPDRPVRLIRIDIPLLLGPLPLDLLPVVVTMQEELRAFDGEAFLRLVDQHLQPAVLEVLRTLISPDGSLSPGDLRDAGIEVNFDLARVEIRLEVPFELQTVRMLSLMRAQLLERSDLKTPATFSGYVNLRFGHQMVSPGQPRRSNAVDFDGAGNILGNVVEGLVTFRDDMPTRWQRGDFRIVRDEPEARTRYSLGDVRYGISGFQALQRVGGVAAVRNFGLQPYRPSTPAGQSVLDLDRTSRVEVIVNGQRVRTLELGPGRYDIRDFPFVTGTNDVVVRITDEVGRTEVIDFPFVYDATVLGAGERDFSYALGVPSSVTPSGRRYDRQDFLVSAFHAYGLTDQFTLGANFQGSRGLHVLGAEGRWATGIGTFRLDAAGSRLRVEEDLDPASPTRTGMAVRLQQRFMERPGPESRNRSFASSMTYRSSDFAVLGQGIPGNPMALDLAASFGQRVTGNLYGSAGLRHQVGRGEQADITSADLNFSMPLGRNVTASLLLQARRHGRGDNDNRLYFSISWFPFASGHRLGASYDSAQRQGRLDWSYNAPTLVDSLNADLSLSRDDRSDLLDGSVRYTGYRFTAGAAQTSLAPQDGGETSHRTTLNLATALAFADGYFVLSRPISDSFVLFPRNPVLSGQPVEVNPVGDIPAARSDSLGMAVLPDVAAYYRHPVFFDSPDLPLGYELGQQVYDVLPGYRSGTVIPVGTGATVLGDGYLIDPAGMPLPLEPGAILSIDDPARAPIAFFTSRAGRFRVEGLFPGSFRLTLANAPEQEIVFTVPPGSAGRVDLGRLIYVIEP